MDADGGGNPSTLPPFHPATSGQRPLVAVYDFGVKANILRSLAAFARVRVFPAKTPAEEILALKPEGVFLSNGPADPAALPYAIENIRKILGQCPIFGICLGHQLLALANGMQTAKLKFGHRGVNQPVRDLTTGHLAMTSQNHGYQVLYTETDAVLQRFVNVNDGTCEGLQYRDFPGLSVQFHPEACAGPQDTEWLFDEFLQMMEVPSCR
jgi:carbamoyl-phosphate synthase small subunit